MNYDQHLQRVLLYIDDHLHDDLNADALSAVAGFSTYHFCRVFAWRVGYSVMDYVRSRRLAFAASELATGRKVIDIALSYGFETHSGFSKAFRRHFGCPPEAYRAHAHPRPPTSPALSTLEQYAIGGIVMEPKFISKPEIRLAGYSITTTSSDGENMKAIPAFWEAYLRDGRMNRLHSQAFVKDHAEYGACFPENPQTGQFVYMIGVEVPDDAPIPEEFQTSTLPAATYAVFSTPPSEPATFSNAIQGTWGYIYNEWFPNSGYEYAPGCVDFELYDERCRDETGSVCDVCIPVVKKQG